MVVDLLRLGKGSLSYGHGLHAEKASEICDLLGGRALNDRAVVSYARAADLLEEV